MGQGKKAGGHLNPASNSWTLTDEDQFTREALAVEMIGVCLNALKRYGISSKRLAPLVAKAMASKDVGIPVTKKVLADMRLLSELGNKWARDHRYLKIDGSPKVLDVRGRGLTLQRLTKEFFGNRPVDEILDLGCKTRLMQRIGDDRVGHFGGCVMFTGIPICTLAYSVRSVMWATDTSIRNSKIRSENRSAVPDRTAFAVVPASEFPEFIRVMRAQVSGLIEMSDRWLTARGQRKTRRRPGDKKVTVGIQSFVFKHDSIS